MIARNVAQDIKTPAENIQDNAQSGQITTGLTKFVCYVFSPEFGKGQPYLPWQRIWAEIQK